MADKTQQIPNAMRRAHGRCERYRKEHMGRRPIPETLWKMAAELASEHGIFRTAQVLRLDYCKLKAQTAALGAKRKAAPPMFVELLSALPSGAPECLIELEGPRGKMRIQWKGATAADLPGLSRVLWESA
jgi:hypothetical protein